MMVWQKSWPTQEMDTSRKRLMGLRKLLDELPRDCAEDVGAELSRFLVIRSVGYIEHTFDNCVASFAESKSHPTVANFVRESLFKGRNPSPEKMVSRLQILDTNWESKLQNYLDADDKRVHRELTYMVDRRNKIAHGINETVNRRKSLDLADIALDLGEFLIKLIDPRP